MRLFNFLLSLYRIKLLAPFAEQLVLLLGAEIPRSVTWGSDFHVKHRGLGAVIHPSTRFGNRCVIMQGVTIGRKDVGEDHGFSGVTVGDRVTICANAVVIAPNAGLHISRGTIVGAGAVLSQSTGEWEVWAGNPARMVGHRIPKDIQLLMDAGEYVPDPASNGSKAR